MNWIERQTRNRQIIDMYTEGYSARQIGEKFGISHATVFRILHDAAAAGLVQMHKRGRPRGDGRNMVNQEVAVRMRGQGKTYQVIGDELGVTRQRAKQIVDRASREARRG